MIELIDFDKEFEKYDFFENFDEVDLTGDIGSVLNNLLGSIRRIGKDQKKTTLQLDEIFALMSEYNEKDTIIKKNKESVKNLSIEKKRMLCTFMNILDQLEDFCNYSKENLSDDINKQLELLWKNIGNFIAKIGLIRIDDINVQFDNQINIAKESTFKKELPEGFVVDILRTGYFHYGELLRKASVLVNKK